MIAWSCTKANFMVALNQKITEELDRRAVSSLLEDQTPDFESFGIGLSSVDSNGVAQKVTTGQSNRSSSNKPSQECSKRQDENPVMKILDNVDENPEDKDKPKTSKNNNQLNIMTMFKAQEHRAADIENARLAKEKRISMKKRLERTWKIKRENYEGIQPSG